MRQAAPSQSEETIYRVACRIFRERGYHATPMRTIASALGIQPAALYYWYPSKEDLLFSIMDTAVDALTERVLTAIDPAAPATTRLTQAIEGHIIAVADHLDELSVFLHELKSLNPDRQTRILAKRDRYERIFREVIEDGMERGEFVTRDARLAGFLTLSACNWLYNWYRPDGAYSPREIADAFAGIILNGLLLA